MTTKKIDIIAQGKDEASKVLGGIGSAVTGIGVAAAAAGLAIVAGIGAGVVAIGKLTMEASAVENVSTTFDNLTRDLGGQEVALEALGEATRGMVNETDLMAASNKFLAMGITDTIESTAEMSEMATQLGMAMGEDATASMENFALMMANQSIPRLDSFGISSSKVRLRIAELQAETEGLSKEQAFNTAVMEQGRVTMARLGEQGETSAATVNRMEASFTNLKLGIGQAFIPVMEDMFSNTLQPLIDEYGPRVIEWAGMAAEWLGDFIPKAIGTLQGVWDIMKGGFQMVSEIWTTALGPALAQLAETLGLDTEKLGEAVGGIDAFETILWLAEGAVTGVVAGVQLLTIGVHLAKGAVEWIKGVFQGFERALWGVQNALKWVRDWIDAVAHSIRCLGRLPDWLTPGSPTPFELGLRGIGDAIRDLPELSFDVNAALTSQAGAQGATTGGFVIHNYFGRDSVREERDVLRVADAIADALAIRGVQPAL